jgi:hypothetical protein
VGEENRMISGAKRKIQTALDGEDQLNVETVRDGLFVGNEGGIACARWGIETDMMKGSHNYCFLITWR